MYFGIGGLFLFILILSFVLFPSNKSSTVSVERKVVSVIGICDDSVIVKDSNSVIYDIKKELFDLAIGDSVVIEYTGVISDSSIVGITPVSSDEENVIPRSDSGIFSKFYSLASNKLNSMTLDEKIGQMLLVRYPDTNALDVIDDVKPGGFVFFEKDFSGKMEDDVVTMISILQKKSNIPLLTAVDEEGGSVVRVSSNPNLANSPFLSPRELYLSGGFDLIKSDTKNKSLLLKKLGLNVNLAPVVDVSINPDDYMYDRTLGESTTLTSEYAKVVIDASKNTGVSYVLKHFPGYGNNDDSHTGEVLDNRTFVDIEANDLPPFEEGINSGAEAILISHNTIVNIDSNNPASLSSSVHNLLRQNLNFTGIIMTDDLAMGAISSIDNAVLKAVLAGNDIIMVTDYANSFNQLKTAVENGTLSEDVIDNAVQRIIAWKYYKGLFYDK